MEQPHKNKSDYLALPLFLPYSHGIICQFCFIKQKHLFMVDVFTLNPFVLYVSSAQGTRVILFALSINDLKEIQSKMRH